MGENCAFCRNDSSSIIFSWSLSSSWAKISRALNELKWNSLPTSTIDARPSNLRRSSASPASTSRTSSSSSPWRSSTSPTPSRPSWLPCSAPKLYFSQFSSVEERRHINFLRFSHHDAKWCFSSVIPWWNTTSVCLKKDNSSANINHKVRQTVLVFLFFADLCLEVRRIVMIDAKKEFVCKVFVSCLYIGREIYEISWYVHCLFVWYVVCIWQYFDFLSELFHLIIQYLKWNLFLWNEMNSELVFTASSCY